MSKISTNKSWENIFNRFDIVNEVKRNKYFDITADQIKAVDGKEARLMTKVDFRENLSILAVKKWFISNSKK